MAGMIDQLMEVLSEQTERHTELVGLSLEEKDAIIQNDTDALQKLVNLKNMVITQSNRLEKQRLALVKDIAEVTGNANDDLTLADVIDILKDQPEEQKKLREAGNRLKEAVGQLKEVNDVNKDLLETSIEFVEYSLNALRSTISPEPAEYPVRMQSPGGNDGAGTFNTTS
ncbi:MAG: flagellar protein FlgN [Defluviitaleaceae bacterium]|nr:flagellar protein FlgN [Defluviitaleaceae bacterium]